MGITETQPWDAVVAQLSSRPGRRVQPNAALLRVARALREQASGFELYPEAEDAALNLYDESVYDPTFRMRRLAIRWERKRRTYSIRHVFCWWGHHPGEVDEWNAPEEDIIPFLLERLVLLEWRRK
jgi:hypothetical protein